ncbi:MAG: HAD hydrolase family protein, partial [Pseudonocardiaceae bacterium]|nr:HAD hydrolase family protein [Pseudonocardiaceae bacterium]
VSGRPPRWIPKVADAAALNGYAVCANGAVLYEIGTDSVLSVRGLDPMLLHDVVDALESVLDGVSFAAERVGATAHEADVRQFVTEPGYRNPWDDAEGHTQARAELLGHTAVKLLASKANMTSDEMAMVAAEVLGDAVDITFSTGDGLIEVSARGTTKAAGLSEVADRLNIAPDDIISFGDMPNDVEMLRWSGHGVAMANGHPEVLAVADEVTATNSEDGVAQVLERWF